MTGNDKNPTEMPVSPFPTSAPKQDKPDKPGEPLPPEAEADKPEELSAEELRLMADTMPGDGPGDD
jgi:hypothetical protein